MKAFAELFTSLDQTTKTSRKTAALAEYFGKAPESDRLWTIALLSGRRPKRGLGTADLRAWAAEAAGIPLWLFEESYPIVGDLAETIALVLPPPSRTLDMTLTEAMAEIDAVRSLDPEARKARMLSIWDGLQGTERFLFNKLITGGFRVGVSQKLMTRALAQAEGIEETVLAHRIMGNWTPATTSFAALVRANDPTQDHSRPYPFFLSHALEGSPENLGVPGDWQAEWKWDGIRGQLIVRGRRHYLWSRGEELVTDRFPEFAAAPDFIPDGTVIDGEVVTWGGDAPLPFRLLQTRIGRKSVTRKQLSEAPAAILAYDLLEWQGEDWRERPLSERRDQLERLVAAQPAGGFLRLSPEVMFDDWAALARARETSRERQAEGFMLKRRASAYGVGRRKGDWWKWKVDPLSIDAVMIYAQQGHGRRANLFTDFTFAVPGDDGQLVPFTKAYSGLTDEEFRQITAWVRKNTLQRFGPVRQVPPEQVFEIHFEGIQASTRHKAGIALRFPRMSRWRRDKPASEVNTLEDLRELLAQYG